MQTDLILGLPNGSLQAPTFELLSKIGMAVQLRGRSSEALIDGVTLFKQVVMMRPQDLPMALLRGKVDCAICGLDWVVEQELEARTQDEDSPSILRIQEFSYARSTRRPVRIVIFGRSDSPKIEAGGNPVRISAEYPQIARQHYPQQEIFFSHGSTEVKVATGLFDYGIGVTETGSSIKAHGLKIVETLLTSPTVLIALSQMSEVRFFGELLAGALEAEHNKLIKMNAGATIKDQLIATLPALQSPTINQLADGSFAIETVVSKNQVADLIIQLKSLGASGILVQDLDVMMTE